MASGERPLKFMTWTKVREYFDAIPDETGKTNAKQLVDRLEGNYYANSAAIKRQVPTVDFPCGHIAIFNICGNVYRMACVVRYRSQRIYMIRLGTHKEYDRWNFKELCDEHKKP